MSSETVRVTSKGQATIPWRLRKRHGIQAPGVVRFREERGKIVVEPLPGVAQMRGILRGRGPSFTAELRKERRRDLANEPR